MAILLQKTCGQFISLLKIVIFNKAIPLIMSTTTLKAQINELLADVEDERFLQSVNAMLQTYLADEPVALSPEEVAAIEEGERDIASGRLVSHQAVIENSRKRYKELKPNAWK